MSGFIATYGHVLIIVSLVLAVAAVVAIVFIARDVRRLRQPFRGMSEIYAEKGAERALEELLRGVDENRAYLQGHAEELRAVRKRLDNCYTGVGLVKYNAFEDVGGMQSYSLCMLTKEKNGFILTNLVGRNSTRGYALDVRDGIPSRDLSEEEKEAYESASGGLDG
ncbi:MAG: DUF4446 family protein [bacterium]|nr:MAG: DUF4446 family protein [bacterium]